MLAEQMPRPSSLPTQEFDDRPFVHHLRGAASVYTRSVSAGSLRPTVRAREGFEMRGSSSDASPGAGGSGELFAADDRREPRLPACAKLK
jgi:hypothetical protein